MRAAMKASRVTGALCLLSLVALVGLGLRVAVHGSVALPAHDGGYALAEALGLLAIGTCALTLALWVSGK